jgi:uncharacterized protein (DUF433 family)
MSAVLERDIRFSEPLYTPDEAATYLRVPASTFETWVKGYKRHRSSGRDTVSAGFVHALPQTRPGQPTIPFVGLAEGLAARAFKDAGVPTSEIREAMPIIERTLGIDYALASRKIYVEGGRILLDYAEETKKHELAVVRTQQGVLYEVLKRYLQRVTYDAEGYALRIVLPGGERDVLEIDPSYSFGKPVLIRGNARMVDLLDRFAAGESVEEIADDFEVESRDVVDIVRDYYCAKR